MLLLSCCVSWLLLAAIAITWDGCFCSSFSVGFWRMERREDGFGSEEVWCNTTRNGTKDVWFRSWGWLWCVVALVVSGDKCIYKMKRPCWTLHLLIIAWLINELMYISLSLLASFGGWDEKERERKGKWFWWMHLSFQCCFVKAEVGRT